MYYYFDNFCLYLFRYLFFNKRILLNHCSLANGTMWFVATLKFCLLIIDEWINKSNNHSLDAILAWFQFVREITKISRILVLLILIV